MEKHTRIAEAFALRSMSSMPIRELGSTGLKVTAFGLGGQSLLEMEGRQKDAINLVHKAIDLGVNYFDTSTIYGPSRYYLGKALGYHRKNIVLASKVRDRTYNGAKKELDETFKLLKTDYLDLVQLHTIESEKDKTALGKDGALRFLLECKRAGIIGHIGFSSHNDPNIVLEFMNEFDFETILIPINPAVPEFLIPAMEARRIGLGVIGMKVMARGVLTLEVPPDDLLGYAMKWSDVAIVGCSNESDVEKNVIAATFQTGGHPIELSEEIRNKSRFFYKDSKIKMWPSTYQPNWPVLNNS